MTISLSISESWAGTGPLGSAELYDPGTGSWSVTGPLVTPRSRRFESAIQRVGAGSGRLLRPCPAASDFAEIGGAIRPGNGKLDARREHDGGRTSHSATLLAGGYADHDDLCRIGGRPAMPSAARVGSLGRCA